MENIAILKITLQSFILGRQGLWLGRCWTRESGTAEVLRIVEEIQMEHLNVVATNHDIVL